MKLGRTCRILLGVAILIGGGVVVLNSAMNRGTRCDNRVSSDLLALEFACERYADLHGGASPPTLDELVRPDAQGETLLRSTRLPLDPWGRAYRYEPADAEHPIVRIGTLGRDGLPGGADDDADLDNVTFRERIDASTDSPVPR